MGSVVTKNILDSLAGGETSAVVICKINGIANND